MKKQHLGYKVFGMSLITVGALGLALTVDNENDIKSEDSIYYEDGFPIRNTYNEIVQLETDKVEYNNFIEVARITAEKRETEEERKRKTLEEAERQKKLQEQLEKNNISYEGTFNVTFYTANEESTGKSKEDKWYGITASGKKVKEGRTVACPKNIEFGTKIYIEGFGERICEDRGSAINTPYKLDIYVQDYNKAVKLGRQYLNVKVYKRENENE